MPTPAPRSQRALSSTPDTSVVLAPLSRKAAELVHQLLSDAVAHAEANIDLPAPGSVVLEAGGKCTSFRYRELGDRRITVHREGCSYAVELSTDFQRSDWARQHGPITRMPGTWYGTETRVDAEGRRWMRNLRHLVDDGFGNLVEVGQ